MWSSELALRRQILAALLALATLALACAGDARAQTSLLPEALAIVAAREGGLTELDRETALGQGGLHQQAGGLVVVGDEDA